MAETTPLPSLSKAFGQATKGQAQAPKEPDSISKNAPKMSLEMPGPLGAALRKMEAQEQFSKEYSASNATRAKNFTDKSKSDLVISKEDVRNQSGGALGKEFEAAKSKGKEI